MTAGSSDSIGGMRVASAGCGERNLGGRPPWFACIIFCQIDTPARGATAEDGGAGLHGERRDNAGDHRREESSRGGVRREVTG